MLIGHSQSQLAHQRWPDISRPTGLVLLTAMAPMVAVKILQPNNGAEPAGYWGMSSSIYAKDGPAAGFLSSITYVFSKNPGWTLRSRAERSARIRHVESVLRNGSHLRCVDTLSSKSAHVQCQDMSFCMAIHVPVRFGIVGPVPKIVSCVLLEPGSLKEGRSRGSTKRKPDSSHPQHVLRQRFLDMFHLFDHEAT